MLIALYFTLRDQWFWLLFSLLPPVLFLAVPAVLLAINLSMGQARRSVTTTLVLGLLLVIGAHLAGASIVPQSYGTATGSPVRVVSWNTEFWDQHDNKREFYAYIRDLDADVYLLQEYARSTGDGNLAAIDRRDELQRHFPEYEVRAKNEQLTLSRLPVVGSPHVPAHNVLRVDVMSSGERVSTYNAHIPVPLKFEDGLFSAEFFERTREIGANRRSQLNALDLDMRQNDNHMVAAGDFNASPVSGDVAQLRADHIDVAAQESPVPGGTWGPYGIRLWRLDWVFGGRNGIISDYRTYEPGSLSDHSVVSFNLWAGEAR